MLELAKALAKNDTKFFGGWIVAGVEAHIKGNAVRFANKTVLSKAHKAVLDVEGTGAFGSLLKKLRVFLVLPTEANTAKQPTSSEPPQGRVLFAHYFTEDEVAAYTAYTGDENIIHKGPKPIVPGLCMAVCLQERLGLERLDWRISFLNTVRTGELVSFYLADGQITAYLDKQPAFVVKLL